MVGFKGMFSFLWMDRLLMHEWIPVTSLMCGCHALLSTLESQQVNWSSKKKKQINNQRLRYMTTTFWFPAIVVSRKKIWSLENKCWCWRWSFRINPLLPFQWPTCDLKSGLINQVGIESLFRRTLKSITPSKGKRTKVLKNGKDWVDVGKFEEK